MLLLYFPVTPHLSLEPPSFFSLNQPSECVTEASKRKRWRERAGLAIPLHPGCFCLHVALFLIFLISVCLCHRCLDKGITYPPENPILCHVANNVNDSFVIVCCNNYDLCNKDLRPKLHVKKIEGRWTSLCVLLPLDSCVVGEHDDCLDSLLTIATAC